MLKAAVLCMADAADLSQQRKTASQHQPTATIAAAALTMLLSNPHMFKDLASMLHMQLQRHCIQCLQTMQGGSFLAQSL
jgi:hypothetical protein